MFIPVSPRRMLRENVNSVISDIPYRIIYIIRLHVEDVTTVPLREPSDNFD